MQLILASASPRRVGLLRQIHADFDVRPSDIEEILNPQIADLGLRVADLAAQKAYPICHGTSGDVCVLGADTVVYLAPEILGKPQNEADAERMLAALSGQSHEVITGVAVMMRQGAQIKTLLSYARSQVQMRSTTADERAAYIASGEPMDKAGAYAIQGGAKAFIQSIEGSYENIVGLPLELSRELLQEIGFLSAA